MENKKLSLEQIKIESFVTTLNNGESQTVKGEVNALASALLGILGCVLIGNDEKRKAQPGEVTYRCGEQSFGCQQSINAPGICG